MRLFKLLAICALLALLLAPVAVFAQEQKAPEHGVIEFGFRGVTGEVYGRTNDGRLPFSNGFQPNLLNSPLNVYSDYRNAFFIPKIDTRIEGLFGSKNYLRLQSASNGFAFQGGGSLTRDQSVLVSFGQYGHYKAQFRYDQTPHIFSGTTRTLFTSGGRGVWNVNSNLQNALFNALCVPNAARTSCTTTGAAAPTVGGISTAINNAVTGSLVAGAGGIQQFTQQENRKTISGSLGFNVTPDVNFFALFSRENQVGTRPIGMVMSTSSSGYMAEVPEQIDYYTNTLKLSTEFGKKHWDGSLGYQGSFFQNNTPSMLVANPFNGTLYNSTVGPATTRMDLYPDNHYQQLIAQGAAEVGKYVHLMANVTPGFLRQNQSFQPLTTNPNIAPPAAGADPYLPASSLNGKVDTLAMNYTAVLKATKSLKVVAKYQHYKYDDNTPEIKVDPVTADVQLGGYATPEHSSFTTRLFDVGGTWFFTKKNSVKLGYQRGWVDRINREVAENTEDTVYGAFDGQLRKTVTLRVSARHQNRVPQEYDTGGSRDVWARMVDQSTRVRNRGDVSLSWDPTQKLGITAFWGTLQDNFNQKGGVNSLVNIGDASISPVWPAFAGTKPTPIYGPYYAYGVLNNIGRNYGVNANYALTPNVVLFAEYAREKNTGVMVQGRAYTSVCVPTGSGFTIPIADHFANGGIIYSGNNPATGLPAYTTPRDCDPINDVLNASKDVVNSYYGGMDITATKKLDISLYYNLSAGQSFLFADGVNCQIGSNGPNSYCFDHFANWKLDNLTSNDSSATPRFYQAVGAPGAGGLGFPQVVNRIHEVGTIARFKLTDNLIPKIQYIYRQNDYKDWQTMVNPYSFTGLPYSFASAATDPAGVSALQKMLWLGADQPSYRAHIISVTLEYHF